MAEIVDYVLTLSCPDAPGIVAGVTRVLFEAGANIDESQQFGDARTGRFFMRIRFSTPSADADLDRLHAVLAPVGATLSMTWQLRPVAQPYRTLIMVSRFGHCLNDLLYRWSTGSLAMELPVVVSNHEDMEPLVRAHGIPFEHVPVTAATKPEAESRLRDLIAEHDIDLVVLARYMQILSDDLAASMPGRIINIHHSFLPSFKGAKPYHQAYERGVKLVGATAHYVTAALDEGPIIEQDVIPADHRMTPDDLVRAGEEVEARVLARAVRWHTESRIILNEHRTVVFS